MNSAGSKDFYQEDLRKILDSLSQEQGKTVRKLELINEGQKKWGIINDVYNTDLPKIKMIGSMIGTAGQTIHYVAEGVSEKIKDQLDDAFLMDVIGSGDAVMSTLFTLSASSVSPLSMELLKRMEQETGDYHKKIKNNIVSFLGAVAPHLVDTYKGSWMNFDVSWNDAERGAAALMREVIDQILRILSPKKNKTRLERINFIAENLSKDEISKNRIKDIARIYIDTIDFLSKIHQHSAMKASEVEGFLYQADNLLNVFSENIDLSKLK